VDGEAQQGQARGAAVCRRDGSDRAIVVSEVPQHRASWWRVFGAPIVIGVLSLAGLLSALLAGDPGRYFAWFGVGLPIAIAAWAYCRK
jgi:hypothetical protein